MASITFGELIDQELIQLNRQQKIHFTWLCAVRTLPFLGIMGNFNFWDKKIRQNYLYDIFYALDTNANANLETNKDTLKIANEIAASANAAFANAAFVKVSSNKNSLIVNDAHSANAVSTAASAARVVAEAIAAISDSSSNTGISHNAFSTAVAAYVAAYKINIDFKPIIIQDLKNILNGTEKRHVNYLELYGATWDNFQNALEAERCGYWGKLYHKIFNNGFVLDHIALNQRMNVPLEIMKKGAGEVASYLEALEEQGVKHLNEARIIILGDKGAGKTCLSRRLVDPVAPMTTSKESTPGVDTTIWKLPEERINVHIWDFAGHTVTHAVHQLFLSERCLYIIVYDGRTEERNRLEYWLNHVKNYGGDSKAIILVNQHDQHSINIPINSLKEQYLIQGVYTFSIQEDKEKLVNFREVVAGIIQNNPSWNKLEIPAKYYLVKEKLEKLFVNGKEGNSIEHITKTEFDYIAKNEGIEEDKIDELLTNLHDLGVSLRYKDMDDLDTLVLNPEWISHGIYKIINWANKAKKHILTIDDFTDVFKEDINRYPLDKFKYLFRLMKRYELAYETKEGNTLIIPHLLNEDQPAILPDFSVGDSLMLRYKAEQPLPPNTISRFIIRHSEQIKKEENHYLVWRKGVILHDNNGSTALVREEDRTISVSVKGQYKTNFISLIRETLNDIFNSYKSRKPELQYRIERFGEIPNDVLKTNDSLWLPDLKILTHTIDDIPYYDENTRQQIHLNPIVNIYNITTQTLISGQGNQFIDNSNHNTFNFHDCNIGMQENLNVLARKLSKAGHLEEAKELTAVVELLEVAEKCKTKIDVKKKGIARGLLDLAEDLGDENSKLHKTVEGIKSGIDIAQDIAQGYNDIAQWLGLPQVPKPFLNKFSN